MIQSVAIGKLFLWRTHACETTATFLRVMLMCGGPSLCRHKAEALHAMGQLDLTFKKLRVMANAKIKERVAPLSLDGVAPTPEESAEIERQLSIVVNAMEG
jgi:hypothetical protein